MSGTNDEALAQDVAAIKNKLGVLSAADAPKTPEACRELASADPDKFNALLDQGLIGGDLMVAGEEYR